MPHQRSFLSIKGSWTKYDSVQVLAVVYSKETLYKFKNKEVNIDEPTLRSFLGVKSLKDPLPNYWLQIQDFPNEKNLFALFAGLFRRGEVIQAFAEKYSSGNMKGVLILGGGSKQETNLRSALIASGASSSIYRRQREVPYDFSPIFQNPKVGELFKQVLEERVSRISTGKLSVDLFYDICAENKFHQALSLTKNQFRNWLEGVRNINRQNAIANYIDTIFISGFYSIEKIVMSGLKNVREIYLLGENGDGKSLILMAIYLAFNRHFIAEQTDQENTGKAVDIIRENKGMGLEAVDSGGKKYGAKNVGYISELFAYGTHRGRYSTDNSEEYGFMSLFSSEQKLTNPTSWLRNQRHLEMEKSLDARNMSGEDKALPASFSTKSLQSLFHGLLEKNIEIVFKGIDVFFIEKGAQLTFDQLSEGYKSILIFVSDLLSRLQTNQPDIDDIGQFHGIVLVDEIDLHLHPKWQKVIVRKLRTLLPKVQFVFTTHSPTMIQGASDDAVIYRIYRNSMDGKTRASDPYFRKDLNHLMINTLLTSPLFGLDSSRLDDSNNNADTNDTYLLYRINEHIAKVLKKQKDEGKEFITDQAIDELIKTIIDAELGNSD